MASRNNSWKLLIAGAAILIGLGVAYTTINWNTERIGKIEPEVQKNTEHRLQDEIDTQYVKQRLANIESIQKQILDEVRK